MLKRRTIDVLRILVTLVVMVLVALAVQPIMTVLRSITIHVTIGQLFGIGTIIMIVIDTVTDLLKETTTNN